MPPLDGPAGMIFNPNGHRELALRLALLWSHVTDVVHFFYDLAMSRHFNHADRNKQSDHFVPSFLSVETVGLSKKQAYLLDTPLKETCKAVKKRKHRLTTGQTFMRHS